LSTHVVETAYERGWSELQNGALISAAEEADFEVFVTTDKNLKYQQNLAERRLAIVVLIDPARPLVLDQLGLTDRSWTTQVKATESEFYRAIGAAESLIDYARQIGQHWMQGIGVARELCKMRPKPG
jgi:hypothetical protein